MERRAAAPRRKVARHVLSGELHHHPPRAKMVVATEIGADAGAVQTRANRAERLSTWPPRRGVRSAPTQPLPPRRRAAHKALNLRAANLMRPSILNPLFASAASLPGVGPKTGKLLDRLLGGAAPEARVIDLLFHLPTGVIDRRNRPKIAEAPLDALVVIEATVVEHRPPPRAKGPYRVLVEDETGDVLLVFFLANHQWIERSLPVGARRWISGKLELWDGHRQMVHPDRILDAEGFAKMAPVEPVYAATEGLIAKGSRQGRGRRARAAARAPRMA